MGQQPKSATSDLMREEHHYGARVIPCWRGRPASLNELLAQTVDRHPDNEAIVDGATRLTYSQFDEQVSAVAAGLTEQGLGVGDRLALIMGNSVEFAVLFFAVARIGAVSVPISTREHTDGIRQRLLDSGAKIIVADVEQATQLPPPGSMVNVTRVFVVGSDGTGEILSYTSLNRPADPVAPVHVGEEDPAALIYTSGTTGNPKGAVLTGLSLVSSALNYGYVFDLTSADKNLVVAPMSHVTGLTGGMLSTFASGATLIIMKDFKARAFLSLADLERMTVTVMVPAMYNLCLLQEDLASFDLSSWRIGGYGGAPMPPITIERLAALSPGLRLINCYGATETSSPVAFMPPEHLRDRLLSVGLPAPGATILIMDEEGREVAAGEQGELWLSGATVAHGYWCNEKATHNEFVGGYWKSGDIGLKDDQGFVFLTDRKKDFINRGGFKIPSVMIENILLAVDGVIEAAVIAKPCEVLGERIHAVVCTRDPALTEERIKAACSAHLTAKELPESFSFSDQPLPRNANGKIMKRLLRERLTAEGAA